MIALAPIAKIFAVLLAGIVISKSYVDFRARVESLQMFLFWLLTWTIIVFVALFPEIVDILISSFGQRQAEALEKLNQVFGTHRENRVGLIAEQTINLPRLVIAGVDSPVAQHLQGVVIDDVSHLHSC